MSDRKEFEKWCISQKDEHGLPFFITKDDNGKYIDHGTVVAWQAWQAARAQSGQEEDGKGSLPWFVHVYNSGYEAGHHDTVEGGFTPIHHSDKDTYHEDQVLEILEDLNVRASRDTQPAQQGSVPEGWKLVPVEPTKAMLYAAEKGIREMKYNRKGMTIREWSFAKTGYVEMLAAAPLPPQESDQ